MTNTVEKEEKGLDDVYKSFCGKSNGINGRSWIKLLQESSILDKTFTKAQADLLFVKHKKGTFLQDSDFVEILKEVADKKKIKYDDIVKDIINVGQPTYVGTVSEYNRFFDEKNAYTGVHRYGGPSTFEKRKPYIDEISNERLSGKPVDLQDLLDRTPASVRGLNLNSDPSFSKQHGSSGGLR